MDDTGATLVAVQEVAVVLNKSYGVVVLLVVVVEPLRLKLVPRLVPDDLLKSYSMTRALFWVGVVVPLIAKLPVANADGCAVPCFTTKALLEAVLCVAGLAFAAEVVVIESVDLSLLIAEVLVDIVVKVLLDVTP